MKKKILIGAVSVIAIGLFGFTFLQGSEDNLTKNKVIGQLLFRSLQQAHFNQVNFDNDLSEAAFDVYLERMDPGKFYLLQEDVASLKAYADKIDDEFNGAENPLFTKSKEVIDLRMEEASAYYKEILAQPLDFSKKESFELDADKRGYASTKSELRELWEKNLRYQALLRYSNRIQSQKDKIEKGEEVEKKSDEEIEKEVRDQLIKDYNDRFDFMLKVDNEDRFATYMNAIVGVFGPHTEYFPPQKKETFDFTMSGRMEGIGARLQQTEGSIKVVEIVPGSASWKQGELAVEDHILKVAQDGESPVSVEGVSIKKAVSMIRGKKGTKVILTVKKPSGELLEVPIIRDIVVVEDQYARSAVVEKDGKKMGLIDLPSFYADFSRTGGRTSGNDVKQEVLKLKEQGVEGIILDLRDNGGGSLQDAIEIAGLFFETGPVVQVKNRFDDPTILKDKDPTVQYDGPLVVMVNKLSASASEIVAAALQDYNRAVVVGSESSYGKGTVQRFIELDNYIPASLSSIRPAGALKLTIQKFYRITGASTQVKGVVPDIFLPDIYNKIDVGEKDLDFVLPWDEITPASYNSWTDPADAKISKLAKNSQRRVAKNDIFQLIEENSIRLKVQRDKTLTTLNLEEFIAEQEKLKEEAKKYKNMTKEHPDLGIQVMADHVKADTKELEDIKSESMNTWKESVMKDVYVYEAVNILNDILK